jgi:UDP-N-acetylmuramoyl-L-alanyl-D-glutamate--2,6-diaminopimelate ligase
MSIRTIPAIAAGRLASWYLRKFKGGGSSYPGYLALKIDKDILAHISDGYEIIVITGTNGKTLTTSLIVGILRAAGHNVITNSAGSNMIQGIVTTFLTGKRQNSKSDSASTQGCDNVFNNLSNSDAHRTSSHIQNSNSLNDPSTPNRLNNPSNPSNLNDPSTPNSLNDPSNLNNPSNSSSLNNPSNLNYLNEISESRHLHDFNELNTSGTSYKNGSISSNSGATSNVDGANKSGIFRNFAVLEIDEASLRHITKYINPELYVFTNVFRDQMDRYGEIYTTYKLMIEGAAKTPNATILANGDSPLMNSLESVNPRAYYGTSFAGDYSEIGVQAHYNTDGVLCPKCHHILCYHHNTYANLGDYFCPNCDFKRPELRYTLSDIVDMDNNSSTFVIDDEEYSISVGGTYNVYNALAAVSVAEYFDIDSVSISKGLEETQRVFGRQEILTIEGKKCTLVLVKNPVGLNQVIDMISLAPYSFTLVFLLNANYADGLDTSWIWDGNHENVINMDVPQVIVGGERHEDMHRRMDVAGINEDIIVDVGADFDKLRQAISQAPTDDVYILATYTAVMKLREYISGSRVY